jgi:hypothetical protein
MKQYITLVYCNPFHTFKRDLHDVIVNRSLIPTEHHHLLGPQSSRGTVAFIRHSLTNPKEKAKMAETKQVSTFLIIIITILCECSVSAPIVFATRMLTILLSSSSSSWCFHHRRLRCGLAHQYLPHNSWVGKSPYSLGRPETCEDYTLLLREWGLCKNRFFPGHIHAFYLEYVYFNRRDRTRLGNLATKPAPGIYSENVQSGGATTYGTVAP